LAVTVPEHLRVCIVSPEPTPYRAPLFDRISEVEGVDLTVVYAAPTIGSREWTVPLRHRATVLRGWLIPARRLLFHDYPITPQIWPLLSRLRPDVVVVPGWSLFAAQAAILWCRVHRVPYVITSESHSLAPRRRWAEAVKALLLPRLVAPAAGYLVTGRMSGTFLERYGADSARIRVFANTPDAESLVADAARRSAHRDDVRRGYGFEEDGIVVVSVARLLPQKAPDVLIRAVARSRLPMRLLFVGGGPEREALEALAHAEGVDAIFAGHLNGDDLVDAYLAGDIFALLSRREPWGVVVNEALACGLPVVLSDRVGAGYDLVEQEGNGVVVPVDDVEAAALALGRLAGDPELRRRWGLRSRELIAGWSHAASVRSFMETMSDARRGARR
jgi:glycosyltransferase involved in cell wall biosynthesis